MSLIVVNRQNHPTSERTVVVSGIARSGTSMVATVLEALGVFMGTDRTKGSLEDKEISNLLEREYNDEVLKALIDRRNATHSVWGWKRPAALKHAEKYSHLLRNACYILTFRDLAAVAVRRSIAAETDLRQNLRQAHRQSVFLLDFLGTIQSPCLLVSNETAVLHPTYFVNELIAFLGVEVLEDQRQAAIASIAVDDNPYLEMMQENKAKAEKS